MNTPEISIVVPAFNRSATLARCLASIERQSFAEWEAILVDDGSTDATADIAAAFAARDRRFRLVRHERRRGAQAARNTGIRAGLAPWIAFLDSDDVYLPESLELRLKRSQRDSAPVVHSECLVLRAGGEINRYRVPPFAGSVFRDLLIREGPMFQALLVRRSSLQQIGPLDEGLVSHQEWDTMIRLARRHRFAFEPEPTFIYDCRHSDSISKNHLAGGRGYEAVIRKHRFAILRSAGGRALARHYQVAARWYREAQSLQEAERCELLASMWSSLDLRARLSEVLHRFVPA